MTRDAIALKIQYSMMCANIVDICFPPEASKVIMQYVAAASGKGRDIDRVKEQLLQSNPVLEGKWVSTVMTLCGSSSVSFQTFILSQCVGLVASMHPPVYVESFLMLSIHRQLQSFFPFLPRHCHHHHFFTHIFFFSSHYNVLSCMHLDMCPTSVPLILSFLNLSSLVTQQLHLNILMSATSNFFSYKCFLPAHVSALYIIAVVTTT